MDRTRGIENEKMMMVQKRRVAARSSLSHMGEEEELHDEEALRRG